MELMLGEVVSGAGVVEEVEGVEAVDVELSLRVVLVEAGVLVEVTGVLVEMAGVLVVEQSGFMSFRLTSVTA